MPYTGFHPALGERKGKHNRYVYISLAFSDWNWLLLSLSLVFPLLHSPCQHYTRQKCWDVVMKNPPAFDSMLQTYYSKMFWFVSYLAPFSECEFVTHFTSEK